MAKLSANGTELARLARVIGNTKYIWSLRSNGKVLEKVKILDTGHDYGWKIRSKKETRTTEQWIVEHEKNGWAHC